MAKRLARGLPGMEEVPVLRELNDIREHTRHDLSVYDRDRFNEIANILTNNKYTEDELEDAYLQLHMIVDAGGSDAPMFGFKKSKAKTGKNAGKYDIYTIAEPDQERVDRDNKRSREMSAIAMLSSDQEMLPVQTNKSHLSDTEKALKRFLTSGAIGSTLLANSGIRTKVKQGSPEMMEFAVQNWNDKTGGYDRFSRDYTATQDTEFGHYVPAELGGSDTPDNGRMQAMSANRAMGKRLGVEGALSALGPSYQELNKRFAGDRILEFIYNNKDDILN